MSASNTFGRIFTFTSWGESHGAAMGAVIDGVPAGLSLSIEEIQEELDLRRPGRNDFVTSRKEKDQIKILSGVFEGQTTGAPLSLMMENTGQMSSAYEAIKDVYRPGHANFTYMNKYGVFDYRGGGRSSARETAMRVAVGAVAKKILMALKIETCCYLQQLGKIEGAGDLIFDKERRKVIQQNATFAWDNSSDELFKKEILRIQAEEDSLPGLVTFVTSKLPIGLGEPIFEKLEANLAKAMMSIPASKSFEMGMGKGCLNFTGSSFNDTFSLNNEEIELTSNRSGGTLGGMSHGGAVWGRVGFKPTSSIGKKQKTLNQKGEEVLLQLGKDQEQRHDPAVVIRAVPVVEAMLRICLVDAILMNLSSKMETIQLISGRTSF